MVDPSPYFFLPRAHTCSNGLLLPICSLDGKINLPEEKALFDVYDMAFSSNHFGSV